jgi:hypothetical protein
MASEKEIGMTVTGEIFQPIRLHYQVFSRDEIEKNFNRLRCIEFDTTKNRWVWLYNEEAESIAFENKFSSIPEEIRPIIIGSFFWKGADALVLDVRSYERALEAIKFFDKEISRSAIRVTHCSVVNKIFEMSESSTSNFDNFFENNVSMIEITPEETIARMKEASLSASNQPNFQAITSFLDNELERFFEVEKFPTHFYEDGIKSLKGSFILRRIIAMERWRGNVTYSYKDALKKLMRSEKT